MNLYEIVNKYKSNEMSILNLPYGDGVGFFCGEVTISNELIEVETYTNIEDSLVKIPKCVDFALHNESDEWYHFYDNKQLGYSISIKK